HASSGTGGESGCRGRVQSEGTRGEGGAEAPLQPGEYRSLGLGGYGSVTATAHGAAFSHSMAGNEPRMMTDTGAVARVPVNGNSGVTNPFGVASVCACHCYLRVAISPDVSALPEHAHLSSSFSCYLLSFLPRACRQ
ncbi:fimbria/pilus outer membrane usher protein, partial [Salmonella enterica]|uniref:fimbria/pilus outer membrane usher protein n=1 Tax=Salmonella enterica TaxID=28901 RepID=UPI00398C3DC3